MTSHSLPSLSPSMVSWLSLTRRTSSKPGKKWMVGQTITRLTAITNASRHVGKYVGNRPIKLKKADNSVNPVEIGHRKAKQLEKELKKNRHKPY